MLSVVSRFQELRSTESHVISVPENFNLNTAYCAKLPDVPESQSKHQLRLSRVHNIIHRCLCQNVNMFRTASNALFVVVHASSLGIQGGYRSDFLSITDESESKSRCESSNVVSREVFREYFRVARPLMLILARPSRKN